MTKQILLIDVDGHNFPNLCLMKISAFYKARDYKITLWQLTKEDRAYLRQGSLLLGAYDKIFAACIFAQNKDVAEALNVYDNIVVGGSGISFTSALLPEIEHICPDYELYNIKNTAYGYLTRGCPRGCPFCIVARKEGAKSVKVADLKEFWNGQKYIKLLDPNLLASKDHMQLLEQLADSGAWIDFTQGLDARLTNKKNLALIKNLKIKMLHFAWDNPRNCSIKKDFLRIKEILNLDARRLTVYVLTNYWSTLEQDLERIYWLRDNGYSPYVMVYNKQKAPKETRNLQRWCNNKIIFRTCEKFEDYR